MKNSIIKLAIATSKKLHYVVIFLLLFIAGLICYYIFKHEFDKTLWTVDNDFKQYVLIFIVTSIVTIFGVESVIQYQKDRSVTETLKILNYGYYSHELLAKTLNFLSEYKIIEYDYIDPIFHNYYETKKGQVKTKKEGKKIFRQRVKQHIIFIENLEPNLDKIIDAKITKEKAESHLQLINEVYERMISKINLSLKVDSETFLELISVIQIVDNQIWYLNRYIQNPNSLEKRKRVFVGSFRLLYVLLKVLKNEKLFFISEIDYDKTFLGKHHSKIDKILS